jgi:hypothetical protein
MMHLSHVGHLGCEDVHVRSSIMYTSPSVPRKLTPLSFCLSDALFEFFVMVQPFEE